MSNHLTLAGPWPEEALSHALNHVLRYALQEVLLAVPPQPAGHVFEALRWLPADVPPADDAVYLLQVSYAGGKTSVWQGQWLGGYWSHPHADAAIQGTVRFYADPKGPAV